MDFHAKNSALKHKQTPEVLPASQYLQDRLLERRARHPRPKRSRQSDLGPRMAPGHDDDLFFAEAEEGKNSSARPYDSSPLAPFSKYGSEPGNLTLSSGGRKRRTPGVRELDDQMDRLNKQNFDLKLEIDHRRENQAKMQAEIESMRATVDRAQRLEEEHEELLRINSRLVEELEKRDKAIQEAAEIIIELEEKVEEYEESRATETRPSTAHADSGYAGTETHEQGTPSSPPEVMGDSLATRQSPAAAAAASTRLNNAVRTQTPARPKREPSFLTSQKGSTTALRSVYLDAGKDLHPVKSFNSILSKRTSGYDEDNLAEDVLNSPRLSALSESSFPSIYGKKGDTPEKFGWEDEIELPESERPFGSAHSRQDSITRVNQWIEDRQSLADTPSKSNQISSPLSPTTMMASPQLRRKQTENSIQSLSSAAASARSNVMQTPASIKPFPVVGERAKQAPRTPAGHSNPVFGDSMLPPTPESVSTHILRPSHSNMAGERSLLDTTPAHQLKTYTPLEPVSSANPKHMQTSPELHGAYSNPGTTSFGLSQSAVDDDSETDDEYHDAMSDTVNDIDMDYDGYPDGNSITNGTPSRFLQQDKPSSTVTDMFFNASEVTPPARSIPRPQSAVQRRKSSAEVKSPSFLTSKPDFHRADTSPTVIGSAPRRMSERPATSGNAHRPRFFTNASSTIRLVNQDDNTSQMKSRPMSPESTQTSIPSATASATTTRTTTPSPPKRPVAAPTSSRTSFSQKTQNLFRRLSNTSDNPIPTTDQQQPPPSRNRNRNRERERSPLPTLTSTPAAAYQMRKPPASTSTSNMTNSNTSPFTFGMTPIVRPGSRAASRDRSLGMAGSGSRAGARPASTGPMEVGGAGTPQQQQGKRGMFRRGSGVLRR